MKSVVRMVLLTLACTGVVLNADTVRAQAAPENLGQKALEGLRKVVGGLAGERRLARPAPAAGSDSPKPDESAVDPDEKRALDLERMAKASFRRNRYAEAIRHINDLITIKPYDPGYHFALALCFRQELKYRDAQKKYKDVLDLGGPKALLSILQAEVFAAENDRDKAYEYLREAALTGRNIIADVQNIEPLKPFEADTEFIRLALQLEKVEIQRSRRDPFTNPFPKVREKKDGADANVVRATVLSPAEQFELLQEANKLTEKIKRYVKLQDEDRAMDSYMQLKSIVARNNLITVPKIVKQFDKIVRELPDVETRISGIQLRYFYNQAHAKLKSMREVFEDGEYARVDMLHAEVEQLARQMKAANKGFGEVADQVLDRSRKWRERAGVRMDFEKQRPEIQGIIISDGDKMTILDERIVKQGESLKGFRVVMIESNRVTFRYRGEEIPLVFRRF